jgi:hypothetical protein
MLRAHFSGKMLTRNVCSLVMALLSNAEASHAGPLALD